MDFGQDTYPACEVGIDWTMYSGAVTTSFLFGEKSNFLPPMWLVQHQFVLLITFHPHLLKIVLIKFELDWIKPGGGGVADLLLGSSHRSRKVF